MNDPPGTDNTFTGLAAGSYNVKVADARGCSLQKNFTLTQPGQVSMNLQGVAHVKCYGEATGEIEVLTTGGVQDYTYKLNGAPASPSGLFKDLTAGNYTVEVSDLNSCSCTLSTTIDHENPPISTLLTPVAVTCYGESDGEIKAELSGGSGGFTSSWEKLSETGWDLFQISGTNIGNLVAGVYRLRAIDSDNCTVLAVAEVKEPGPLLISNVTIKDAVCYGDQGSLGIEATGGNPGYVFQYTPNNNMVLYYDYTSGEPVSPGIYGLRVTDTKGCMAEGSGIYHVTSPPSPLSLEFRLSEFGGYNVSCHGNNDGRLEVVALGGNGSGYTGYTYSLEGRQPQEESFFPGLEAGSYDITITDRRGCRLTKTAILIQPESSITLKAASVKNPVCFYDTTGSITLAARGGALPYEYSINGGTYSQSAEFTDLPVNNYSFKVRDVNGCAESLDTVLQSVVSEMSILGDVSDVKCFGETSGSVNVSVSGGAKPFTYHWKENGITTSLNTNLTTGKYTVVVKDSAGCLSEKQFLVSQPELPLNLFLKASYACDGLKDGEIAAFPRGGTPPYRYDVDQKSDFRLPPVFKVYAGDHVVYLADSNGCQAERQIKVSLKNTMPDINFMLATSRYELDTLVVVDVSVPAPEKVTWEFSPEAAVIDTGKNKAYVRYNQAGLYPVRMTGLFGSCAYTIEKLLKIAPFDPSVISMDKNKTGIKTLKISPNPNNGSFELLVELYTKQQVMVAVYDIYSRMVFHEILPADILFVEAVSLPETLMPGTYILRLTAENDSRTSVFVISE